MELKMAEELMTFEETRKYLNIKRSFLYKLLQTGKIPGSKIGRIWRIRKSKLDQWLDEQEARRGSK